MYPPESPTFDDSLVNQDIIPEATAAPEVQKYVPTEDDIKNALEELLKFARDEDRQVRDNYLHMWKRLDYYWNNILDIFFDPIAHNWTIPDWDKLEDEIPPRLINIFRPHGEAIVAALSVTIPTVTYPPDDADNPDDIEASVAYKSITELLEKHNDSAMLFIKAIVIMFCSGTIFGYNYYHRNPKFGTIKKPKIEPVDVNIFEIRCPTCGAPLDAGILPQPLQQSVQPQQILPEQPQNQPQAMGSPEEMGSAA